jgi:hypothetical protein
MLTTRVTRVREQLDQSALARARVGGPARDQSAVHVTPALSLLRLQRTAGNAAVGRLLRLGRNGPVLARAGWTGDDVRSGGWNAEDRAVGSTLRLAIQGIKLGNTKEDPRPRYTTEKAGGRAIVIVPPNVDWQQVDVLLHFHGHGEAYRELTHESEYSEPAGTVRDVESEQIEQQLEVSGRRMIAILPQGTAGSSFDIADAAAYIDEVLSLIPRHVPLSVAPKRGRVVVSSHSGGGPMATTVAAALAAPRSATEEQWLRAAPLFLFDSINGTGELKTVKDLITSWLDADLAILQSAGAGRGKELLAQRGLRFLSTFSPGGVYEAVNAGGKWTDKDKVVHTIAPEDSLIAARDRWFVKHKSDLGTLEATLKAQYRIDSVRGEHIYTVSTGFPATSRNTNVAPIPTPLPKGSTPDVPSYKPGTGHLEQALRQLYPETPTQRGTKLLPTR